MGQKTRKTDPGNLRALELIREAKKASGLSAVEISARTGIPRSTIANYLSTKETRDITATRLALLAKALDVDPGRWITEIAKVSGQGVTPPPQD